MVGFPKNHGVLPTKKKDHFGVFGGYHHAGKHLYKLYGWMDVRQKCKGVVYLSPQK